ncbi:MAG: SIS domain-containing protein [Erysipelothrix sp.]|nr:SIS domain-containing protein [Erysipelothrix sp.]
MFNKDINEWVELGAGHTAQEITQQPKTWIKTYDIINNLKDELKNFISDVIKHDNHRIIFTGAGTSKFVGNTIKPVLSRNKTLNVDSVGTTDLVVSPELYFNENIPTLLVSFGRSGNSPESIAAVDLVDQISNNVKHLSITCNHEGKLATKEAENFFVIKLPEETNDQSLAMTSSYSNMYLAALLAFNLNKIDNLKEDLEIVSKAGMKFNNEDYATLETLLAEFNLERLIYLGDAQHTGVAQESALKALELSGGKVSVMHNTPLGFRHGPKSFINKKTLITVFLQNDPYVRKYQKDLINEIKAQQDGYQILAVDFQKDPEIEALVDKYMVIQYNKDIENGLEVLNLVMIGQTIAFYKSLMEDLSPDNPSPTGVINRIVQGVVIYPYNKEA